MKLKKIALGLLAAVAVAGTAGWFSLDKETRGLLAALPTNRDLLFWSERQRDAARQPAATLAFFGLRADQTVVEIWPSVGLWWFEILAPYLRDKGEYIAALHAGAHNPQAGKAEHEAAGVLRMKRVDILGGVHPIHDLFFGKARG